MTVRADFIQFLRPHGERSPVFIEVDSRLKDQLDLIRQHRFELHIEMLTSGDIHMTISDEWGDYYSRLCANGPPVVANVDALLRAFQLDYALAMRANLTDEESVH